MRSLMKQRWLSGALGLLMALCWNSAAVAQDLDDLASMMPESLTAMKEQRWEDALKLLSQATALKQDEALRAYGPQFGVAWYRRGICEMKLHRWAEAIHSFETCYRDYPNRGPSGGNLYQSKALLKWGEAAVGAKQWELAISRFRKFLEERDKRRDQFNPGIFYVTLGICHYKLGEIGKGNEQLEIAIRNRAGFPTSDEQILAGVQVLVEAALVARDEAAMVDFINSNREALVLEPRRALVFSATYLKLSGDCAGAGMNRAALALLQFVIDPRTVAEQVRSELAKAPESTKPALQAELARVEGLAQGDASMAWLRLQALADAHESLGQIDAACEARERIHKEFPDSSTGEQNLRRLGQLRLNQADALLSQDKRDEAITLYEKAWSEGGAGPGSKAAKRWMELLWERNRDNDRLAACRGGHAYLDQTKDDEIGYSDEDRELREEVARLTRTLQEALSKSSDGTP